MRKRQATIPGFRAPPRPKRTPIAEMTVRELQDLYTFNKRILAGASDGGAYVDRIRAEQAAVESRLMDQGIDDLSGTLKKTKLKGEGDMEVDDQPEPVTSRTIEAKKKALAQYVSTLSVNPCMIPIHYIMLTHGILIIMATITAGSSTCAQWYEDKPGTIQLHDRGCDGT